MKISLFSYQYIFKQAAGTSRGVLKTKDCYFIIIQEESKIGIGEVSIFRGLSADDVPHFEQKLKELYHFTSVEQLKNEFETVFEGFPSICFGIENALHIFNLHTWGNKTQKVPINGLIWMGDLDFMTQQIQLRLQEGFQCLKMKIGAIEVQKELQLLAGIRNQFSKHELEIRVDANGAFNRKNVFPVLEKLDKLHIHSIEQPIAKGNWEDMSYICGNSPIPIALDEELIGLHSNQKADCLDAIQPQYIILKPGLLGGTKPSEEWITLAKKRNIGYWATSALEGNIGLNHIYQWCAAQNEQMPQGLGTGSLYTNNVPFSLEVKNGEIAFLPDTTPSIEDIKQWIHQNAQACTP